MEDRSDGRVHPGAGDAEVTSGPTTPSAALQASIDTFTSCVESSLYVVTTAAPDGQMAGCLVGFVTQCSIVPTRFLFCLSKENHTYAVAGRSSCVALHLLGEDQLEMASLFAEETGDSVDKFRYCRWHPGRGGAPILDDCPSWVEGSILERYDVGDHQANVMSPLDGNARPVRVMTYQSAPSLRPGHPVPE
jgi:flavin reductase (DIM6/NTAB) family NADH-FMN oxidoreductase RutF